jgi:monovalent cation:H+ antiporter-2, CPA2 family
LILVDQGMRLGLVDEPGRQLFLALAIGSLALTPILYQLALKVAFRVDYQQIIPLQLQKLALRLRESIIRDPFKVRIHETSFKLADLELLSGHAVVIGYGIAAQQVVEALKALKIPYRILEMNQKTVKKYAATEPIFFGDATQRHTLESMHIAEAKLLIIAVTGAEIAGAIHRAVRQIRADLPVIIRAQYLRDLREIEDHPATHLVIAEFEGTLSLISESLKLFGVPDSDCQMFVESSRRNLELQHRESRSAATK